MGSSVARHLANENNDISVVDQDSDLLGRLQEELDIRTVAGYASHPDVLRRAGIEDADLILAVTNSDETNMLACQIAYTLFSTPMRLARVRAVSYLQHPNLFDNSAVPINVIVSPEQLVTRYIHHLIERPGVLQVLDFGGGQVQLVCVRAQQGSPVNDVALRDLHAYMPGLPLRIVALFRQNRAIIPDGDSHVVADDEIFFLAEPSNVPKIVAAFRQDVRPNRRIMIAGGGHIGQMLAQELEGDYRVKLVEYDFKRCRELAVLLRRTIVLQGDAADENLLQDEDIGDADVFCALTNDDEVNVLSCMLAKRMGARKVIAIINRPSYVELAHGGMIDIAISPQQVTIGALLTHVRRGDIDAVYSLRRGAAEAIEAVVHGDMTSSKVVGRPLAEIAFPPSTTIGAIIRDKRLILPSHEQVVESGDHLILFLADKRHIADVEQLVQVGITFL